MAAAMEVDNNWIFDSTLGSGSFGIVQLWKNTHNGEKIAIKVCKSGDGQLTQKQKDRWIDEIYKMQELQHPNIVGTRPVPDEVLRINSSLPVLCMEYCRKGDLRRVLSEMENCCGLPEPDAIQIIKDISGAVEYLHARELTHRDLKPENVVLQQISDKVVYKLIDLGYAKTLGHDSVYASIVGTLNYVAPELLWKKKYTCSVDYWSLGILFYEIITGVRPFLPDETNFVKWKQHIEKKSYEDICVQIVNNEVVYLQDIQDPTNISPCIKNALVDWFRVVLQWDAKRRGRQCGENGRDEIVVFKMLKRILSRKVVHVFCVPHYRIYSYQVDDTTRLCTLQLEIERDTQIPISSQEIINSFGDVLNNDTILEDTLLTLFRNEDVQMIDSPAQSNLPDLVRKMIEAPKAEISRYELKRSYSAAIFFLKKEVDLFSYYILGLSMKIDLINSRLDTLLSKKEHMLLGIESLKTEFHSISELQQCDMVNGFGTWQKEIQIAMTKLETLSKIVNDLKAKCDKFLRIRESLREFINVDWMAEYQEFLNKAQDIMRASRTRNRQTKHQPTRMAMLIVKFLKFRQTQMSDQKLERIERQIRLMTTRQVSEELEKLGKFVDSAVALTNVYLKEISNLYKKWQNCRQAASSGVGVESMDVERSLDEAHPSSMYSADEIAAGSSDSVILDNLVMRYMMHDIMTGAYENFLELVHLDT